MFARTTAVASIVFLIASSAFADGLIYLLPSDGSWATFKYEQNATEVKTLAGEILPDVNVSGTFTVRSVGKTQTHKGPARRIELESRWVPDEQRVDGRVIILRMLIPDSSLKRDSDPLMGIREIDVLDRDWKFGHEPENGKAEHLTDPAAVLYEIERLRQFFPFPPVDVQSLSGNEAVTIKVPAGECTSTNISYPTKFEGKLTRGALGTWNWEGTYSLWLSDVSPFGVVAVETIVDVKEVYGTAEGKADGKPVGVTMKCKSRLELTSVGVDAKSAFGSQRNNRIAE